tara:strand:+ start:47 stop:418 length:372 start_codon:yes stop_codon:yes gene_type:complete
MDKEVNEFCQRYDAFVHPSSRIVRRHVKFTNWQNYADIDVFETLPVETETIKCVEVHMPEDQFRALIENKQWLDEHDDRNHGLHIHRVQKIIAQHEDETRLRHQHAGVMDAWQQYQTMLQLVK